MNDTPADWLQKIDMQPFDIAAAFTLLTRIPLPVDHAKTAVRASAAAWAFPLVGSVLGAIAGVVALACAALGVPSGISAGIALATLLLATGALHEDGLSDCADGLGGGGTAERCLEIMKDSRIGAYGAAALGVALIIRWSGYQNLADADWLLAFIAVGTASRLPMVLIMFAMPLARPNGLAAGVGMVPAQTALIATLLTLLICGLAVGFSGLAGVAAGILIAVPLCWIAWRKIEGYTGDVLGCSQQLAEIAALAALTALL